ncbi:MAG: hypothetical protein K2X93_15250 [Candidatus Obscuribacterales bacterium]|nr:hypothetical protein [Candidatus Obscuribacterales bacterium]
MHAKDRHAFSKLLSSVGDLLIRLSGSPRGQDSVADESTPSFTQRQLTAHSVDTSGGESTPRKAESDLDEERRWLSRLAEIATNFHVELGVAFGQRGEYVHVGHASDATDAMIRNLYSDFNEIGTAFNTIAGQRRAQRVRVTVSDYHRKEKVQRDRSKGDAVIHFRIATTSRQLVVVGKTGKIHFYLAPSTMALNLKESHVRERRKLSLRLASVGASSSWTVYGLPVNRKDVRNFVKMLFRDLVILSAMDAVAAESGNKFEHINNLARVSDDRGFKDTLSLSSEPTEDLVRDLLLAQQNAVHKLLNQQEETQATIARDLHDGVLADILMLRRKLSSESTVEKDQIDDVLDKLTESIRDICSGLVPRDLKDWGLETVLQDLIDKVADDTQADCSFDVDGTIPELPSQVQLHIFRIVQECLNNVKKYAEASAITLSIMVHDSSVRFKVADNGKGFDTSDQKARGDGGFGLPGIEERVEIIRAFYPTRFRIDSKPGEGTAVTLELVLSSSIL